MYRKLTAVALFASFWIFANCYRKPGPPPRTLVMSVAAGTFDSYDPNHRVPENWTGPRFALSQAYPQEKPPPELRPWEDIDFKTEPVPYLNAVLRYAFEGNLEHDWVLQKNTIRRWYHAPWLHVPELRKEKDGTFCRSDKGREFVHGLTRERYSSLAELNYDPKVRSVPFSATKPTIQNWAVAMYNAPGGWVLGQVWNEMTVRLRDPLGRMPLPKNVSQQFPDGTVAVKLLFTEATPDDVPYLKNSPEWDANINRVSSPGTITKLRLVQIDLAVRDPDAAAGDGSGWVFGTFAYRYHSDPEKSAVFPYPPTVVNGLDVTLPWRQLEPIGLMWGNAIENKNVNGGAQTVLARPDIDKSHHLGCEGRLSGPVDNQWSSCIACHGMAEVGNTDGGSPFSPLTHSNRHTVDQCHYEDDIDYWFKAVTYQNPLSDNAVSLDFSLQLQNGILRFCQFNPDACPPITGMVTKDQVGMPVDQLPECAKTAPCSRGQQVLIRRPLRAGEQRSLAPCGNNPPPESTEPNKEVLR